MPEETAEAVEAKEVKNIRVVYTEHSEEQQRVRFHRAVCPVRRMTCDAKQCAYLLPRECSVYPAWLIYSRVANTNLEPAPLLLL